MEPHYALKRNKLGSPDCVLDLEAQQCANLECMIVALRACLVELESHVKYSQAA